MNIFEYEYDEVQKQLQLKKCFSLYKNIILNFLVMLNKIIKYKINCSIKSP